MIRFALIVAGMLLLASPGVAQESFVHVDQNGGLFRVAAAFSVPEPALFVRAALTDYPRIPRFMPGVRISQVLEHAGDRTVVEQEAIAHYLMFSKRVHLVLDVQDGGAAIRFKDRCGKSFQRYEGMWAFTEREGRTDVTYELAATPLFDVPEFLLKRLMKRDASQMIERLKIEIAARAR